MRKVRELLKLKYEQNLSVRVAAKSSGMSKTSASEYLVGFKSSGIPYSSIKHLSDSDLLNAITQKKECSNQRLVQLQEQFPYFEKELKRPGVTLQLLWKEYQESREDFYGYSQFCHHYYQWRQKQKVSMRQEHKAGDKLYVDFTGKKLAVINPKTGEEQLYEVFVSVLGASQYSYIEAVSSQKKEDWISVNENALRFYGGVPAAIVPDCLKSAVKKATKYEPEINQTYQDFAGHYNTVILPARALHPQDKSLAENFVRNAYREIFAPLRNMQFFAVQELNEALWEQLDIYNQRKFQGREYSRKQLFDEIEKQELRSLPQAWYELKTFCSCTVHYNHHFFLREDSHYYSVPYRYTGKQVIVSYTLSDVEVYYNNQRIAFHKRDVRPYKYTTVEQHRPKNHQYQAKWTPDRFLSWASNIAPEVEKTIRKILESRPHPEQAYNTCMGLLNLEKKYNREDYVKACTKALSVNCLTYKFIKNTLDSKSFNMDTEEELQQIGLPDHKNIRGKESFN